MNRLPVALLPAEEQTLPTYARTAVRGFGIRETLPFRPPTQPPPALKIFLGVTAVVTLMPLSLRVMDSNLQQTLTNHPRPVILLEGTRKLPDAARASLVRLAHWLCARFPHAVFRSGNAEGTDSVFADAVAARDPSRLELVLPHRGMGRARRPTQARCFSLEMLPRADLERIVAVTRGAGREAGRLGDHYLESARATPATAKASYLLRDTLKVVGSETLGLAPASLGIFFVNETDPTGGGTGHTIKVCHAQAVPVATQSQWATWTNAYPPLNVGG